MHQCVAGIGGRSSVETYRSIRSPVHPPPVHVKGSSDQINIAVIILHVHRDIAKRPAYLPVPCRIKLLLLICRVCDIRTQPHILKHTNSYWLPNHATSPGHPRCVAVSIVAPVGLKAEKISDLINSPSIRCWWRGVQYPSGYPKTVTHGDTDATGCRCPAHRVRSSHYDSLRTVPYGSQRQR